MKNCNRLQWTLFALLLALVVTPAWAQRTASLSGTVSDSSGAVIPGASVQLTNAGTGEQLFAESNESGNYTFPLLPAGIFDLTVEQQGFKAYIQPAIEISTGTANDVDIALEVGVITETVTVTSEIPQLRTEESTVSVTIKNETIANMPLINRRAGQLARLNGFMVQRGTGSNFAMAGGRGNNAMWIMDGGIVQNMTLGVSTLVFDPPVESLEEFTVNVSNYKAEMGRSGGGTIQMTTKSGSNDVHGSLYEFLRNDAQDARNFFSASKPKLRRNQFGGSVGGPIKKNKTHFFFNVEIQRQIAAATRIQNVPDIAERAGDFSGISRALMDPLTQTEVPNNIIPMSQFDSVGRQLAALYPDPNVPNARRRRRNYLVNQGLNDDNSYWITRVDHVFGQNDRMFGRFVAREDFRINDGIFPTPGVDNFDFIRDGSYFNPSVTWFHNFTPTTIMETRFTWARRKFINRSGGADQGWPAQLGLLGTSDRFFPRVNVTGLTPLGRNNHERLQEPIRTRMLAQTFTHVRGNHTFKYGYEYRIASNDDRFRGSAGGRFSFNPNATGDALASLLYGHVINASRVETLLITSRANAYAGFVQDDWKVNSRLTLNLGLRWDMDQPRWEQNDNRQNSFNRNAINPVAGVPGIVTFSGRGNESKFAHNFDKNNFGPRLGFAYRIGDNTVIRGGGAVMISGAYDQATPVVANLGFSITGQFSSPDGGITRAFAFQDGVPFIPEPDPSLLNDSFGAVPVGNSIISGADFFDTVRRNPYSWSGNFNIQHQLPHNMLFEVGYITTLGHKLAAPGFRDENVVPLDVLAAKGGRVRQTDRRYPQFGNVRVISPAIGNSNYHGVNFKLEKRYSSGLHFGANYTWSKFLDDVESRGELGGNLGANAYANYFDRRADKGLSGNHIAHRFIWSSVYELPYKGGGALGQLLGGWSVGLIAEFRTGSPFGVIENNASRIVPFAPTVRSDAVGSYARNPAWRDNVLGEEFFDTSAFAAPQRGQFGNLGRTVAIGPSASIVDLSILKDFQMPWEGHRLQFRTEMLNMPNHPNFNLPEQRRGRGNFGDVSSLIPGNAARIIQFGLHYKF